jgi:HlyD family secretion protein
MQNMSKITQYSNKKTKFIVFVLIGLLIVGTLGYFYIFPKESKSQFKYVTKPLKKGNLTIIVTATGYIQPVEEVKVGSEISGTIEKVFVDYNDIVKKGQILAQIDKTKYQSALNKAESALTAAKASLKSAKAKFSFFDTTIKRDRLLLKSTNGSFPSQNVWDSDWSNYLSAKAEMQKSKAQIQQAEAELITARYNLSKTTIYSPINGIILERNIDPGQTVVASFQTPMLFKIAKDLTKMELHASVDEADIAKVKAGQNAYFTVDAYPDKKFNAKVKLVRVNSEIVEGVVTYKAIMNVDNKNLLLKPGMSADVDIVTKTIKNNFIVPKAALLFIPLKQDNSHNLFKRNKKEKITMDKKPHIWILKNGKVKKVYVKIIGSSGFLTAISSKKLEENDKVVIMQEKVGD